MSEQDDYSEIFGTPASGKKEIKWKRHRLKVPKGDETKTEFICRIIPPLKSCKAGGEWFVGNEEFFGYDVPDKNNKGRTKKRSFAIQSPYDSKRNPAIQKIYDKKQEMTALMKSMAADGATNEQVHEAAQPYKDWLESHNRDFKFNLNVYTQDGQLYVLQLTPKAKDQLLMKRDELLADGVDILDPKTGAWMVFTRIGSMNQISSINDSVAPLTEMVTLDKGVKAQVIKPAPITGEMAKKIAENAPDLKTDISFTLPLDLVEKLVNGPEDPNFVEQIWNENTERKKNRKSDASEEKADDFFKKQFGV